MVRLKLAKYLSQLEMETYQVENFDMNYRED